MTARNPGYCVLHGLRMALSTVVVLSLFWHAVAGFLTAPCFRSPLLSEMSSNARLCELSSLESVFPVLRGLSMRRQQPNSVSRPGLGSKRRATALQLRGASDESSDATLGKGDYARVRQDARAKMRNLGWKDEIMNVTLGQIGLVSGIMAAKGGLYLVDFKETKGLEYLGTKVFLLSCLDEVTEEELKEFLMDEVERAAGPPPAQVQVESVPPLRSLVQDLELRISRSRKELDAVLARMREEAFARGLSWTQIMQTEYGDKVAEIEDSLRALERQLDDLLDAGSTEQFQRVGFPPTPPVENPEQPTIGARPDDARKLAEAIVKGRAAKGEQRGNTSSAGPGISREEVGPKGSAGVGDEAAAAGGEAEAAQTFAELLREVAWDLGGRVNGTEREDDEDASWVWFEDGEEGQAEGAGVQGARGMDWGSGGGSEVVDVTPREVRQEEEEEEARGAEELRSTEGSRTQPGSSGGAGEVQGGGGQGGEAAGRADGEGSSAVSEPEVGGEGGGEGRGGSEAEGRGPRREGGGRRRGPHGVGPALEWWEAQNGDRGLEALQDGEHWRREGWGTGTQQEAGPLGSAWEFIDPDDDSPDSNSMDDLEDFWMGDKKLGGHWVTMDQLSRAQPPVAQPEPEGGGGVGSESATVPQEEQEEQGPATSGGMEDSELQGLRQGLQGGVEWGADDPNTWWPEDGGDVGLYMLNATHGVPIMRRSDGIAAQVAQPQSREEMQRRPPGAGADYMIIPRPYYAPAMDPKINAEARALAGRTGIFKCNTSQPSRFEQLWMQKGERLRREWLERHPPTEEAPEPREYEGSRKYPPGKKWWFNGAALKKQRWNEERQDWVELDEDEEVLYSREHQGTTYIIPRDDDAWGYAWFPDGYEEPEMDISHLPPYRQQLINDFSKGIDPLSGLSKVDVEFQEQLYDVLEHSAGKDNESEAVELWLHYMLGVGIDDVPPSVEEIRSGAVADPEFADRCCGWEKLRATLLALNSSDYPPAAGLEVRVEDPPAGCACSFQEMRRQIEAEEGMEVSDVAGVSEEVLWFLRRLHFTGFVQKRAEPDQWWFGDEYLEYAMCNTYGVGLRLHGCGRDGWEVQHVDPSGAEVEPDSMLPAEEIDGALHLCLCGNHFWAAPQASELWEENQVDWANATWVSQEELDAMSPEEQAEVKVWDRVNDPDVKMVYREELERMESQTASVVDISQTLNLDPAVEYDAEWMAKWNTTFWKGLEGAQDNETGVPLGWLTDFDWEGFEAFEREKAADADAKAAAARGFAPLEECEGMDNQTRAEYGYVVRQLGILDQMDEYYALPGTDAEVREVASAQVERFRTRFQQRRDELLRNASGVGEAVDEKAASSETRATAREGSGDATSTGKQRTVGDQPFADSEMWDEVQKEVEAEGLVFEKFDLEDDQDGPGDQRR